MWRRNDHGPEHRVEFEKLLRKYPFERIDDKYPRSVVLPCPYRDEPDHTQRSREGSCACDHDGVYRPRIGWVNASEAWAANIEGDTVILSWFGGSDPWPWFSVDRIPGEAGAIRLTEDLRFIVCDRGHASSCEWYGGYPGSGIRRIPEDLQGFVYRTQAPDGRDSYVRPDDIIVYVRESAATRHYVG